MINFGPFEVIGGAVSRRVISKTINIQWEIPEPGQLVLLSSGRLLDWHLPLTGSVLFIDPDTLRYLVKWKNKWRLEKHCYALVNTKPGQWVLLYDGRLLNCYLPTMGSVFPISVCRSSCASLSSEGQGWAASEIFLLIALILYVKYRNLAPT